MIHDTNVAVIMQYVKQAICMIFNYCHLSITRQPFSAEDS